MAVNIYKKLLPRSVYIVYGSSLTIRYTGDPTVSILFFLMKYFELILKWHSNTVITVGLQSTRSLLIACCIKLRIHLANEHRTNSARKTSCCYLLHKRCTSLIAMRNEHRIWSNANIRCNQEKKLTAHKHKHEWPNIRVRCSFARCIRCLMRKKKK